MSNVGVQRQHDEGDGDDGDNDTIVGKRKQPENPPFAIKFKPSEAASPPPSSMWNGLADDFGATPPASPELGPSGSEKSKQLKSKQLKAALITTLVVESAACVLTFLAGYVNAVSIILFSAPVAHVTGLLTRTAMVAEEGEDFFNQPSGGISQVFSFMAGSALCGLIIGRHRAKFGLGLYGVALILVAGCLLLAFSIDNDDINSSRHLCALAMGLQNGIGSTFS